MTQVPRTGFIQNGFSGKCLRYDAPGDGETSLEGKAVELGPCTFNLCDSEQIWEFTDEGFIRNAGSGLCIAGAGTTQEDKKLVLGTCIATAASQRWRYYDVSETTTVGYYQSTTIPAGFLRNQHTGRCLGIEDGTVGVRVNDDYQARSTTCSFDTAEASDQQWSIVVPAPVVNMSTFGYLVNTRNQQCLDVEGQTGNVAVGQALRSYTCEFMVVSHRSDESDQLWTLADGTLKNKNINFCAVPEATTSGAAVVLGSCSSSLTWTLASDGSLEYGDTGLCLEMGSTDGTTPQLLSCSLDVCSAAAGNEMQWFFHDEEIDLSHACAARCEASRGQAWALAQSTNRRRAAPICSCKSE
eukprot:2548362-Amphidinium_carterae.1